MNQDIRHKIPDPTIHKMRDPISENTKIALEFSSEQHFKDWIEDQRRKLHREGYELGLQEALQSLQQQARNVFKLVFGKEL